MKIAIIGAGISGMGATWLLDKKHDVTLYEAEGRLGGHARTRTVKHGDTEINVDTGFIVFNYRNYPNLNGLFDALDVDVHKSDMSFAARIEESDFEYSSKSLGGMFPNIGSLFDARRWKIVKGYRQFGRQGKAFLDSEEDITLGEFLDRTKPGEEFIEHFILPIGAAIWSCPVNTMRDYPAKSFLRFFENHGLLAYNEQPEWYTVKNGSQQYVQKLHASLRTKDVRVSTPVQKVEAVEGGVEVTDESGNTERFDHVVLATHGDISHKMLSNPTDAQANLLSRIRYQPNHMVLHADTTFMPKNKKCWASWVYHSEKDRDNQPRLAVSYWMNLLQGINERYPLIVTLNPTRRPQEGLIFDEHHFDHPIFDGPAVEAQAMLDEVNGQNNIWLAGAWTRYGFHEDGLRSGVEVARKIGAKIPWE